MRDLEKNYLFQIGSVAVLLLGISLLLPPKDSFRVPHLVKANPNNSLSTETSIAAQPVEGDLGNIVKSISWLLKGERQPASID